MILYSLRKRPIQSEKPAKTKRKKLEPERQWARRERDSRRLQRPPRPARLGPLVRRAAVRRREAGDRLGAERQRPGGRRAAPGLRELRVPGRPSPLRCQLCGAPAAAPGERTPALRVTQLWCPRSRGEGWGKRASDAPGLFGLATAPRSRTAGPACAARPSPWWPWRAVPQPQRAGWSPALRSFGPKRAGKTALSEVRWLRPGAAAPPQPCSRRSGPRGSATPAAARACSS